MITIFINNDDDDDDDDDDEYGDDDGYGDFFRAVICVYISIYLIHITKCVNIPCIHSLYNASHYNPTVPMWHDAGVTIYPLLSQFVLMGKHSW